MHRHAARAGSILALVFVAILAFLPGQRAASAHPLDQLTQHLFVDLRPAELRFTVAVGGGILANELVLSQIDTDGDGVLGSAEQSAWLERWARTLRLTLDGEPVPLSAADLHVAVPEREDFHVGVSPILITFSTPLPASGPEAEHLVSVRNEYLIERTTYRIDVSAAPGTELLDLSWPGATIRVAFTADPAFAGSSNQTATDAAQEWSGSGVLAKAREALEHERTPGFILTLLGIFALMGALHAIQPGHGKTLVAAYLVATGGTPRHAFALAGIVTATHTISVFALGLATLAASEFFLPSEVIPVMGVLSGLLVAAMGLAMLRGSFTRWRARRSSETADAIAYSRDDPDHRLAHRDGLNHDHARLTPEEHARLHLEGAMAVRRGVSNRNLLGLGVAGGMAPCPDALAILLLAIGMNQAGLGMLAIVAFSFGLAAVLVAFGLGIALARPAWQRARRPSGASRLSAAFGRLTTAAPLASATIVLLLGLAMAWRSLQIG